ncbi:peptidylprolyl isomerase [Parvularcula oceani]|uniref:peptidylprolyl isomerase n=1 Tax=Parvularcula oceani TaxID=1247963 RepID=UPI0004E12A66|nr:peptidylprolyl isomerase [Parvularcula oceani]
MIGQLFAAAALAALAQQGAGAAQTPQAILERAPDEVWEPVAPENLLVMDLPSGTMLIEMRPDLAPAHVERIRELTRQGFYDGVAFHRVIDGFMAQGGDPTGTGQGGSDLPDLQGEFAQPMSGVATFSPIGRDNRAAQVGFVGAVPVGTQPPTMREFVAQDDVALWGLHCPGVLSMARANDPNSANSQFFVMFGDNRTSLDQRYTVWGRVVEGQRNMRRINRGEPPERPTPIVRARIAADMPEAERPKVEVLRSDSETFAAYLQRTGAISRTGYLDDVCNVTVPVRVNEEIQS